MNADLLPDPDPCPDQPSVPEPWDDDEEDTDLDYVEMPCTDGICPDDVFPGGGDDERWEAFIPDDDELDPQPDRADFRLLQVVPVFALAA